MIVSDKGAARKGLFSFYRGLVQAGALEDRPIICYNRQVTAKRGRANLRTSK
jgi:hypothetical protein